MPPPAVGEAHADQDGQDAAAEEVDGLGAGDRVDDLGDAVGQALGRVETEDDKQNPHGHDHGSHQGSHDVTSGQAWGLGRRGGANPQIREATTIPMKTTYIAEAPSEVPWAIPPKANRPPMMAAAKRASDQPNTMAHLRRHNR